MRVTEAHPGSGREAGERGRQVLRAQTYEVHNVLADGRIRRQRNYDCFEPF